MDTAMKIAYVGDFTRDWNTEVHVAYALGELDHEVLQWSEAGLNWRQVPRAVARDHVQLLLWTHSKPGNHADQLAALTELRNRGVPTVSYHLDRWWGLSKREAQVATDPFFRTDLVCTADGGHADRFQMAGVRHVWLPPAIHYPDAGRGQRFEQYAADVAFIGHDPYPHPEWADERHRLIRFLADRYGPRFRLWPEGRSEPVRGPQLRDVIASTKVVVGDSCLAGSASHYWSDRVPVTLGMGGLLVHPRVDGMEDWYTDDEHLLTFDLGDLDALGALVDATLAEPDTRQAVTDAAIELVVGRDTYTHRMRDLLGMALGHRVHPGWLDGRQGVVQVQRAGARARFDLRPGSTDGTVVREVWQQDHYRMGGTNLRGKTVVDVGAHIGALTVLAAKLGARVLAVEPEPSNHARLVHHLAMNAVESRVRAAHCAVCDGMGTGVPVPFRADTSGSHIDLGGDVQVPAWELPKLLADHGLGAEPIALLKVDCEGCEYLNLRGLAEVLPRVDRAVFEFHGPRMPHMGHLQPGALGGLVEVLAEHGTVDVQGRPSTGGMLYWARHR